MVIMIRMVIILECVLWSASFSRSLRHGWSRIWRQAHNGPPIGCAERAVHSHESWQGNEILVVPPELEDGQLRQIAGCCFESSAGFAWLVSLFLQLSLPQSLLRHSEASAMPFEDRRVELAKELPNGLFGGSQGISARRVVCADE